MNNAFQQFTLRNDRQMTVKVMDYGCTITNILVPSANGEVADVVLGFDNPEDYAGKNNPFFGCIAGRYANRIAGGHFSIDGVAYQLPINNGPNTLHGGIEGFNRKIWRVQSASDRAVTFHYTSPDGEEGFPGTLRTEVTYSLSGDNALRIDYHAVTDKPTIINLTNHSYFNLSPYPTVAAHEVRILADTYIAVNKDYIPTGKIENVAGTAMDFRKAKTVGQDLDRVEGGFDHTWVMNKVPGTEPQLAASVYHPGTGRHLEVFTTQPGMQFYTGNFLNGTVKGRGQVPYIRHAGLCLETQHFPDSPNQPSFPSAVLRPREQYRQSTIYKFSVK